MAINSKTLTKENSLPAISEQVKPESQGGHVKIRLVDFLIILAVVTIWGVTFVGIKTVDQEAPPFQAAGIRFMLAGLALMPFALQRDRLAQLRPSDFAKFAVIGLLQTATMFGIVYNATKYVPGGVTSIIVNTNPFFVALLAHFFIKGDHLNRQRIWGLVIGFTGVVLLVLTGKGVSSVPLVWPLILIGASFVWGTSSVLVKVFKFQDIISVTTWQMTFGSIPLLLVGFFVTNGEPINWNFSFIFWTLFTAFLASSFCWWAWYSMLKRYSASRVSVFLFLVPVSGVISGILFLGESLSLGMVLGGGLVVAGIIIVNIRLRRQFAQ